MSVQSQVHAKFKVFLGSSIEEVTEAVRTFTADGSVAAKSIGIEYVEGSAQFLLSLGYAEEQGGYPVTLTDTVAGSLEGDDVAGTLAQALEEAAAGAGEVICHELYVDKSNTVHMVFMGKA